MPDRDEALEEGERGAPGTAPVFRGKAAPLQNLPGKSHIFEELRPVPKGSRRKGMPDTNDQEEGVMSLHMKVMPTPRSVDISITRRCNLRCTYCSHFESDAHIREDLDTAEWLRFFQELGRCRVMRVTLGGGEPFCRQDLPDLLQGITENRMRFTLLSNGTLITDAAAAAVARTGRCDAVQISIDGSTAESHDLFRGRGTFVRAVEGIRSLQRHGVPVTVRVTIHQGNVHDLPGVMKFLLDDLKIPVVSTNAASYLGKCRQHEDTVGLSIEEQVVAMEHLVQLSRAYPGRIHATAGPLADARMWREMVEAKYHTGNEQAAPGRGYLSGCGCTATSLSVRSDGAIVPCVQLNHIVLGTIGTGCFEEIWLNHPQLQQLRMRRSIPLSIFAECRECPYISACTGGCPALAYTRTGELDRPSPDGCFKRFLDAGGRLPVEREGEDDA